MRWWILLSALFLFTNHDCEAQSDSLRTIVGLATKEAYQILVDKKGYVWVAHELGLSRYDGLNFIHYSHPEQVGLSLFDLVEDDQGRIWCHNLNNQIFYIENGQMFLLKPYYDNGSRNYIRKSFLTNELVISSFKGIYIHNTLTQKGRLITTTINGEKIGATLSFCKISNREILIKSERSWLIYTQGQGIKKIEIENASAFENKNIVIQKYPNKDTIYAADAYKGILYKVIYHNNRLIVNGFYKLPGVVNGVSVTKNHFWINTSELTTSSDFKQQLINRNITSIAEDLEGNTWYSSIKGGILFKPKNNEGNIYQPSYLRVNDFVTCIANDTNFTLQGTALGDVFFSKNDDKKNPEKIEQLSARGGISRIYTLGKGKFLIASLSRFFVFDANKHHVKQYPITNDIKNFAFCKTVAFVANSESLSIINLDLDERPRIADWPSVGRILGVTFTDSNTKGLSLHQRAKNVCYDSANNTLYVNFVSGLYRIDNKGVTQITYQNRPVIASSLAFRNGVLYVGTLVNGLLILKNGSIIKTITTKDGLSANTIVKLKLCNSNLWLLSSGNIQFLNTSNNDIERHVALPTLLGSLVYDIAEINGEATLATTEGIYKVPLNNFKVSDKILNYLTHVVANQKDSLALLSGSINDENIRSITFSVVALWYNNPQGVYFKYRLLGTGNDNWQNAPPYQRSFSFSSLSPGKYEFQAVAINGSGVEAQSPISFVFTIKKPWWQQWWLYLIILAVLIDIVYLAVQERIDTIKKRNELLVQTIQLQSEVRDSMLTAIKSQMNPHFIFNALNTIQSFIYTNDKSKANSYLGKFSNLIRIVLDSSNKKAISLTEEVETLQLYIDLEVMRFENTLQASIEVDASLDTDSIFVPPMLVQPFVENAIKHGLLHKINNRKLTVSFKPSANKEALEIIIDDNGIGRERSAFLNAQKNGEHNSFAIKANQTRIDILNQLSSNKIVLEIIDKKDADNIAKGTTVKLFIPNELLV